jgi:hypothetical protein
MQLSEPSGTQPGPLQPASPKTVMALEHASLSKRRRIGFAVAAVAYSIATRLKGSESFILLLGSEAGR